MVKVSFLQLVLLAIAGWWTFHLYRLRRQGESTMRIEAWARIAKKRLFGENRLFIRVHIINPSAVLIRKAEATLVLLDGTAGTVRSAPTFRPLWKADPILLAVAQLENVTGGYVGFSPRLPDVEPNDCLESETVYCTKEALPHLIGVRITVVGTQGRWRPENYEWSMFAFLDPSVLGKKYGPLSFHIQDKKP